MEKYRTEELYNFNELSEIVAFLKQPNTYLTYTTQETGCMKDVTEAFMDIMHSSYCDMALMERQLPDYFEYENVIGHKMLTEEEK